jgi:hypothetical protein
LPSPPSARPSAIQRAAIATQRAATRTRAQAQDENQLATKERVGEDAASFDFGQQSVRSWAIFFGLLTTVLGALYLVSPRDPAPWCFARLPAPHPRWVGARASC